MHGYSLITLSAIWFRAALFFLAAWALYVLLKPVNKNLALLFLLLNLISVVIQCASDLFLVASQLLMNGPGYLKVFQVDQLQSLAMFSLDLSRKSVYGRLAILWRLALSAGLFGFQVGLSSKIFGYRADGSLFYLGVDLPSVFPLSRLHGHHLCKLSTRFHCGIRAYLVAADHGRQGAEITWKR